MFYFFFESPKQQKDPLVIWLNGRQDVVVKWAFFYENGPFTMVGIRHQTFCMSTSPMELVSVIVLISATFLQALGWQIVAARIGMQRCAASS
ncbi:hypothetical protein IFM89_036546 [Coptis chinensis]|uniref:Uncharacterized protein n=1 Tax=Coptis chinensis TaxID=261450 RepID=A0A835HLT5_9MAGN|nr:hypothetical protein IFM89_036546 [Coptis chinensis]